MWSAGPTPACAGITSASSPRVAEPRAFPRVRGDHCTTYHAPQRAGGLPPRARGSHRQCHHGSAHGGPTPACAGITSSRSGHANSTRAYPRVRGDHRVETAGHALLLGLPPRARGSRPHGTGGTVARGPTPACAGITGRRGSRRSSGWAYPRVRGDHQAGMSWGGNSRGLPPRARGSLNAENAILRESGPTPACAGITPPRSLPPQAT